jgi:beta-glucosidase
MTLTQKAAFVVLQSRSGIENTNGGVPSLCIPPLILSDGPNGIAYGLGGVTQLPAAIGVAASFDPAVARSTGQVMGAEARTKGIDVVQGPELNLARVPQSGRIFETFGEDPYLTSVLGVASIEGIQSTGVMANAKHFSGYTQETARERLNQIVPTRALAELYNAPFHAAVEDAHVASIMCSYGSLNGVNTCSSPYIYETLRSWGFTGFVRSDLQSVFNATSAFKAGLALIKPATSESLLKLVRAGKLPVSALDRAVRQILATMFAYGLIAHPRQVALIKPATTPTHTSRALNAAEESVVLLKNRRAVLPLAANLASLAVIGTDASSLAQTSGEGSSEVKSSFSVTPLVAIKSSLGAHTVVKYAPGGPASLDLDQLNDFDIVSGTLLPPPVPIKTRGEPGKADLSVDTATNVSAAVATATKPATGEGWSHWRVRLRAHKTGWYEVSMQQVGDTWLYLDGRLISASSGLHGPSAMSTTLRLQAHHAYTFSAKWFAVARQGSPRFGIVDVTPQIAAAAALARQSQVAVVFAGAPSGEGTDQQSLNLPGDGNALISAVAAANPRTVVVLNTGGAVLMPWLAQVSGVLEAWYPGEEDGPAIAAVLTGAVDPAGRLPITFPSRMTAQPMSTPAQFPGVASVVNFGSSSASLEVGYRWYQSNRVAPLFAFGYGLSYTSFKLSGVSVRKTSSGVQVHLTISNQGARTGADVVQVYVRYPRSAGEPPEQLRAFDRVVVSPDSAKELSLSIPWSGFQIYRNGLFTTVVGQYGVDVGESAANLSLHFGLRLS